MFWWILLFYLVGLVLVIGEFIVPGGIVGVTGAIFMIGAVVYGAFTYPDWAIFIVLGGAGGAIFGVIFGLKLLPHTPLGRSMILTDTQDISKGWVSAESNSSLVGQEAEAYTPLRPAGTILIDGKRYDAVSSGDLIAKGARVRVLEVHGSRIVVEEMPDAG